MKKKIHPPYQEVLFVDSSTGKRFVCGSTLRPEKTEMYEGKEYPVFVVSVSSASHPFFTGSNQFIDSEGRVDKFFKRYAVASQKKEEKPADKEGSKQGKKPPAPKKAAAPKKTEKPLLKKKTVAREKKPAEEKEPPVEQQPE